VTWTSPACHDRLSLSAILQNLPHATHGPRASEAHPEISEGLLRADSTRKARPAFLPNLRQRGGDPRGPLNVESRRPVISWRSHAIRPFAFPHNLQRILRQRPLWLAGAVAVVMTAHDTAMVPTPPGSPPAGTGGRRGPHPRLWPGRRISSGSPVQARSAKQPVGGSFASGGACSCAHDGQDSRLLREGSCAPQSRGPSRRLSRRRRGGGSTPAV
jgi:hypothetical protein